MTRRIGLAARRQTVVDEDASAAGCRSPGGPAPPRPWSRRHRRARTRPRRVADALGRTPRNQASAPGIVQSARRRRCRATKVPAGLRPSSAVGRPRDETAGRRSGRSRSRKGGDRRVVAAGQQLPARRGSSSTESPWLIHTRVRSPAEAVEAGRCRHRRSSTPPARTRGGRRGRPRRRTGEVEERPCRSRCRAPAARRRAVGARVRNRRVGVVDARRPAGEDDSFGLSARISSERDVEVDGSRSKHVTRGSGAR